VVGDPQGHVTYMNPAFERRFNVDAETSLGQPLAALFVGGVRESVLSAVVRSCASGETTRFRVRHEGTGFYAVTSPIVANGLNIGVVILIAESAAADERCLSLQRDFEEPLAEVFRVLDELLEQTGGKRSQRFRTLVEDAMRSLERAKKASLELHVVLSAAAGETSGGKSSDATLDPSRVIHDVAARVREHFESAKIDLEILLPGQLPTVRGDTTQLEKALVLLLDSRAKSALESETVTMAARSIGRGDSASVVISVVDSPSDNEPAQGVDDQAFELVRALGGEIRTTSDAFAGRTTSIRLPVV